jgi:hypothetical protein
MAGHVRCMRYMRNAYEILVEKHEEDVITSVPLAYIAE